MPYEWSRTRRRCAALGLACTLLLLAGQGCKTQKDAEAAARQMAITAKVLCDYYTALDRVLAETEDAYQAQYAINQTPPMDLKETREQVRHRAAMAEEIGDLAGVFQKLTGSTAATDASAAAGKLNDEAISLAGLSSNDAETKAVTIGIKEIVLLVQQHEEKKAAAKLEPLCDNLLAFFRSEERAYDSIDEAWLRTARSNARYLVRHDQVDSSQVFVSSLHPFGLRPELQDAKLRAGMQTYLLAQIDREYDVRLKHAQGATEALEKCLHEMDERVKLVAHEKPMPLRSAPFSLETVKTWIAQVSP